MRASQENVLFMGKSSSVEGAHTHTTNMCETKLARMLTLKRMLKLLEKWDDHLFVRVYNKGRAVTKEWFLAECKFDPKLLFYARRLLELREMDRTVLKQLIALNKEKEALPQVLGFKYHTMLKSTQKARALFLHKMTVRLGKYLIDRSNTRLAGKSRKHRRRSKRLAKKERINYADQCLSEEEEEVGDPLWRNV